MNKLYVFGDSYAAPSINKHDTEKTWPSLLAKALNRELYNGAVVGGSQDFSFWQLYNLTEKIDSDDVIVVVLTHPSRMWYVPDDPSLGYSYYVKNTSKDVLDAAKKYEKYIQNPFLDLMKVEHRLAWLSYTAWLNDWGSPIIIEGFYQEKPQSFKYKHIIMSNGNLTSNVSAPEVKGIDGEVNLLGNPIYEQVIGADDYRFNHLILSNHRILVDKLLATINKKEPLDLKSGFIKQVLDKNSIKDVNFAEKELNPNYNKKTHVNNIIDKFKLNDKF
jgi:hypothetical protein